MAETTTDNITVYMSNDTTKFTGNVNGKEFDFTVNEFINLIGAFQQVIAKVNDYDIDENDIISTNNI